MDINTLTDNPDLQRALDPLRQRPPIISDIIDDAGHQYVDVVMEGGGMLGIALVGYTWAMEQLGIRFLGIGGTSAGAINALLLAALGTPEQPKSSKLLEELANLKFIEFVDGDDDARDLINSWIKGAGKVKLAFKALQVMDSLNERLGLNPGQRFESWLRELLDRHHIETYADLRQRMQTLPAGLRTRGGELLDTPAKAHSRLAIVTADVSTETRVVFPDDADLYFPDVERLNPAVFARASMSIPFFFTPYRVGPLRQDQAAVQRWKRVGFDASQEGGVPDHALFIDGGIMSNFPIDLFHDYSSTPVAPTFGVKLQYDRRWRKIDGPFELLSAIFNSARHCLDYEFIRSNPDHRRLVQWIPCEDYNWLDFDMSDAHKLGLFQEGARKAIEFLEKFDWEGYKALRKPATESVSHTNLETCKE